MALSAEDIGILLLTVRAAALAVVVTLPLALAVGWGLSRWRGPGKEIVETFLSLPLVLPPTAVGIILLELLSQHGILGRILSAMGIRVLFTFKALVIAAAVMSFPLMVRPVRTAFEELDPRLIAIARTLGKGPVAVFFRVVLPLSWRGIWAGTGLAFSRALGEFGATILIAGNIPGRTQTLALAIFQRAELGHDSAAFRLVAITALLAFATVWGSETFARRRARIYRR